MQHKIMKNQSAREKQERLLLYDFVFPAGITNWLHPNT